jgi:hypothetical protein
MGAKADWVPAALLLTVGAFVGGIVGIGLMSAVCTFDRRTRSPDALPAEAEALDALAMSEGALSDQTEYQIQIRVRYLYGIALSEVFWEGPFVTGSGMKAKLQAWADGWARTLQAFYAAKWSAATGDPIYPVYVVVEVVRLRLGVVAAVDPVQPPNVDPVA